MQHGKKFYANFTKRTVRIDRKVYAVKDIEDDTPNLDEDGFMARLTDSYETYKHSIPSEQSDRHRKSYFKALPYEQALRRRYPLWRAEGVGTLQVGTGVPVRCRQRQTAVARRLGDLVLAVA